MPYTEISPALSQKGIEEPHNVTRLIGHNVYLVYGMSKDNVNVVRQAGYDLYVFSEYAPSIMINDFDYDPYQLGIKRLEIKSDKAFYK